MGEKALAVYFYSCPVTIALMVVFSRTWVADLAYAVFVVVNVGAFLALIVMGSLSSATESIEKGEERPTLRDILSVPLIPALLMTFLLVLLGAGRRLFGGERTGLDDMAAVFFGNFGFWVLLMLLYAVCYSVVASRKRSGRR